MGCGRAQSRSDQGRPKNIESEQKREGGQGVHQTLGEEHLRQWGTVRLFLKEARAWPEWPLGSVTSRSLSITISFCFLVPATFSGICKGLQLNRGPNLYF